jgi:hypothetical protein
VRSALGGCRSYVLDGASCSPWSLQDLVTKKSSHEGREIGGVFGGGYFVAHASTTFRLLQQCCSGFKTKTHRLEEAKYNITRLSTTRVRIFDLSYPLASNRIVIAYRRLKHYGAVDDSPRRVSALHIDSPSRCVVSLSFLHPSSMPAKKHSGVATPEKGSVSSSNLSSDSRSPSWDRGSEKRSWKSYIWFVWYSTYHDA